MNKDLRVSKTIEINSRSENVWDALTNPEKIKIYLFGTETITDWKVGSPIVFQGEYNGQSYKDKGNVIENIPFESLKYNYWSGFSGSEDLPENYSLISYKIEKVEANKVLFTWVQEGFSSQEGCDHSENNLLSMLEVIKDLVENS